jgi:hypothetical protein
VPDFTLKVFSGATLQLWQDPARPAGTQAGSDPGAPSRLNPLPDAPHRRYVGQVGVPIVVHAWIGTDEAPLDSALGGRLFKGWWVDQAAVADGPLGTAGQSSEQTVTAYTPGHYTLGLEREEGGAIFLPFDVEA